MSKIRRMQKVIRVWKEKREKKRERKREKGKREKIITKVRDSAPQILIVLSLEAVHTYSFYFYSVKYKVFFFFSQSTEK